MLKNVFISYARADALLKDNLVIALTPLEQAARIKILHDAQIRAGEDWQDILTHHLQRADFVLLLVTHNFLASEECRKETEVAVGLRRQGSCRVIPIIAENCNWQDIQYAGFPLKSFQVLPTGLTRTGGGAHGLTPEVRTEISREISGLLPMEAELRAAERASTLDWNGFAKEFEGSLVNARRMWLITRTCVGWIESFYLVSASRLSRDRQSRLLCLDPASQAFAVDTDLVWTPSKRMKGRERYWSRTKEERKPKTELFYSEYIADGQDWFSFRVAAVPIPYAMIALFSGQDDIPIVYAELPVRPELEHGNRYMRVDPRESQHIQKYLRWMENHWDNGSEWVTR